MKSICFLFVSLALLVTELNCQEKVKLNKIIGGYSSYTNTWPWMVSLRQVIEFSTCKFIFSISKKFESICDSLSLI